MSTDLQHRILAFINGAPGDFDALALEVYAFQREHNAVYRAYCEHRQACVSHWKDIPAVPTSAFKDFALTCFPVEEAIAEFHTSGTTREKTGKHSFKTLELYDAAIRPNFQAHLQPGNLAVLIFTPSSQESPHSSLSHMMGVVAPHGQYVAHLPEVEGPVLLLGTAFAFMSLFDQNVRLKMPAGSRAMETGGYKGRSREVSKGELYRLFRERFGIEQVVNEYGMTELSTQFYDETLVVGHQSDVKDVPHWARVLIINPNTGKEAAVGERGMIRVFDLANLWSSLCIQTEDLGIAHEGGRFEVLGRAAGVEVRGCSLNAESLRAK